MLMSLSEPDSPLPENRPAREVQTIGWSFHPFRVMLKNLGNQKVPCGSIAQDDTVCRLILCLNGRLRICFHENDQTMDVMIPEGSCCLQYHPDHCRCIHCTRNCHARYIELTCPASRLLQLVCGSTVGREIRSAIDENRILTLTRIMTGAMHKNADSLESSMNQCRQGSASLLLARLLEIIWQFSQDHGDEQQKGLSMETRNALGKARTFLETNMTDPPPLDLLAARVGISLSKLKETFPKLYGMPPYAYLRKIRMERARELLTQNKLSVTETAFEVGYSNISYFSKCFFSHFGIKPSQINGTH